jgi:hypothetical protein
MRGGRGGDAGPRRDLGVSEILCHRSAAGSDPTDVDVKALKFQPQTGDAFSKSSRKELSLPWRLVDVAPLPSPRRLRGGPARFRGLGSLRRTDTSGGSCSRIRRGSWRGTSPHGIGGHLERGVRGRRRKREMLYAWVGCETLGPPAVIGRISHTWLQRRSDLVGLRRRSDLAFLEWASTSVGSCSGFPSGPHRRPRNH